MMTFSSTRRFERQTESGRGDNGHLSFVFENGPLSFVFVSQAFFINHT